MHVYSTRGRECGVPPWASLSFSLTRPFSLSSFSTLEERAPQEQQRSERYIPYAWSMNESEKNLFLNKTE